MDISDLRSSDIIKLDVDKNCCAIGIVKSVCPKTNTVLFSKFDMLDFRSGEFSGIVEDVKIKFDEDRFIKISTRFLFKELGRTFYRFNFRIEDVFSIGDYIIISNESRKQSLLGKIESIGERTIVLSSPVVLDPKTNEFDFTTYNMSETITRIHNYSDLIRLAEPELLYFLKQAELNPEYTIGGHLV